MPWIDTVPYAAAEGRLRTLYDRVKGPGGNVDNIMMMHSLRPHSMEGHMARYKYVLHHGANTVPKWFRETIGVWVSALNGCAYCVDHHFSGAHAPARRRRQGRGDPGRAGHRRDRVRPVRGEGAAGAALCRGADAHPVGGHRGHGQRAARSGLRRRRDPRDQPGRGVFRLREPDRARSRLLNRRRRPGPVAEPIRPSRRLVAQVSATVGRRAAARRHRRCAALSADRRRLAGLVPRGAGRDRRARHGGLPVARGDRKHSPRRRGAAARGVFLRPGPQRLSDAAGSGLPRRPPPQPRCRLVEGLHRRRSGARGFGPARAL